MREANIPGITDSVLQVDSEWRTVHYAQAAWWQVSGIIWFALQSIECIVLMAAAVMKKHWLINDVEKRPKCKPNCFWCVTACQQPSFIATFDMLPFIPLHFLCTHFWQLVHCNELLRTSLLQIPFHISQLNENWLHTHTRLTALFPGLPRWASARKVKPIYFSEATDSEWQQGHMQVCTLLQTDSHTSTPPLCFYRPDALPVAQPTASKHWLYV